MKSFEDATEAKMARCPKFRKSMDSAGESTASLAPKMAGRLGKPVAMVSKMLSQIRGGYCNVSDATAEAAAPHLGVTAAELLIRPMANPRGPGASKAVVVPTPKVSGKKHGRPRKSSPTTALVQFLKDRKLSVGDVVMVVDGGDPLEEELVDAVQGVGELSAATWERIQQAFAEKSEVESHETVVAVAESNGHLTGQVLFEGTVSPDQFYKLLGGTLRVTRAGGALIIGALPRTATSEDRDAILELVLPELPRE